jgi:hypothetical protein
MVNSTARISAAAAGVVFAIGSVFVTFGTSLLAMIAVAIAWGSRDEKGDRSRAGSVGSWASAHSAFWCWWHLESG